ncbi:MAG: hypothetical protein NUV80_01740 [Candidatus Berkelbacteria bacterium]|nr:hypothetical protein [Candidatus Berkelbacteria bacterium]MCR4307260.1 hypothetical protein [Candidatus Berkelbacteria bacterium]
MRKIILPHEEENFLTHHYPRKDVFVRKAEFLEGEVGVEVTCLVPKNRQYSKKPVPYATLENYVRCLSQACYLLVEHALREKLISVDVSVGEFLQAAANHEIYYRSLALHFHERAKRGEKFILKLSIKNVQEIKRLSKDYILFTFANERTVISGEMSFIYVNTPTED